MGSYILIAHESQLPVADRRDRTLDLLRRRATTVHCYRVCGMAREAAELQP
jgi:hypothetical protein